MSYIGLSAQKRRNNIKSTILLFLFPALVIGLLYIFCFAYTFITFNPESLMEENTEYTKDYTEFNSSKVMDNIYPATLDMFITTSPFVLGGVLIWFLLAYFFNTGIISAATGSKSLSRQSNKRIYNLVENLCMSQGMSMPKIDVIEDDSLNAFASGINKKSYTVTLTRGIIKKLDDQELEAVIAHELTHIRNRDVRTLIVSIVFVGIFSMISSIALRMFIYGGNGGNSKDNKGNAYIIIVILVLVISLVGYFFSILMRFAISRQREYMADAGAAEMTKNPWALASALRKISADPIVENVKRDDVAQLFISHPLEKKESFNFISTVFATHPPIEKRIEFLEHL